MSSCSIWRTPWRRHEGPGPQNLIAAFAAQPFAAHETVIRVNALGTAEFDADLRAAATCRADAVLLPKVDTGADLEAFAAAVGKLVDGPGPGCGP
jgi:citrate lyase subunit beta/citryl-CoA lyase